VEIRRLTVISRIILNQAKIYNFLQVIKKTIYRAALIPVLVYLPSAPGNNASQWFNDDELLRTVKQANGEEL
jgi:hypothetical protein